MGPYELWTGKTFDVSFLQTFGQKVAVHIPKQKRLKLDAKCKFGTFVGYDSEVKGYRVFFDDNKVETVRDVVFMPESEILLEKQVRGQMFNTYQEDEVCESEEEEVVILNSTKEENESQESESDQLNIEIGQKSQENTQEQLSGEVSKEIVLEGSDKVVEKKNERGLNQRVLRDKALLKPPVRFLDYEHVDYAFIGELDEPITYKEAMDGPESVQWCEAMKKESDALEENRTWDLVEGYKGKAIDTKWVFRKKKDTEARRRKSKRDKRIHIDSRKSGEETTKIKLRKQRNEHKPVLKGDKPKLKKKIILKTKEKVKVQLKKVTELNRHLDNVRLILLSSNATPIRCHVGIGYKCCYCPQQYPNPADLKEHTISSHGEKLINTFMEGSTMLRYLVKLDITRLKCKLCAKDMKDLDELVDHLVSKHEKTYNFNIKNHIIPFKFETESLKCAVCDNEFNHFKVLLEHMNVHFKNHVCEICGCGFVSKHTLQCHSYRHKTGVFNCTHCPKIFDTNIKRRDHERAVHVKASKTNKCRYCGEKFSDYRKKKLHEVKEHGEKPLVLRCQACDETFSDQTLLTVHLKSFHLMERRATR